MPPGSCQGKGGRTLRWGSWELRSGTHGQQQRAGTFEPPALLLFIDYSVPWGFEGTTPWLNNGNGHVARLSHSCFMGKYKSQIYGQSL